MRLRSLVAPAAVSLLLTSNAFAQQQPPPYTPPPLPPPANYEQRDVPPSQQYTAPMYQYTQPSYVPQSVAMSGPREITNYSEGDPVPPGYRPVERSRKGLIIAGSIVFGTLYFFTAMAAAIDADDGNSEMQALWVPGVGPFIQMASTETASGKFLLAIDGIGQAGGLFMLIYGMTSTKTVLVRNDLAKNGEVKTAPKSEMRLLPMTGTSATGLSLAGTF